MQKKSFCLTILGFLLSLPYASKKPLRTQSSIIVPLTKKKRVIAARVIRIGIFRDINEHLKAPTSVSLLFIVWEIDAQNSSSLQFFHFEMQTWHIRVIFFQLIELQAGDPKLTMFGKLPWREYFYRLSWYILLNKEITKIFCLMSSRIMIL